MNKSKPVAGIVDATNQVTAPIPVVVVGPFAFPRSTAQARAAVDSDHKWSWREDGPALKAAVEAAYDELRAQAGPVLEDLGGVTWAQVRPAAVKVIILTVVKRWDDLFGWDAPNMTEMDEDAFYGFLVNETVGRRLKNAI